MMMGLIKFSIFLVGLVFLNASCAMADENDPINEVLLGENKFNLVYAEKNKVCEYVKDRLSEPNFTME